MLPGEEADLVFTDPPYGVGYRGGAVPVAGDDLGAEGTRRLVAAALRVLPLRPLGAFYVCAPAGAAQTAFRLALSDAGLPLRQELVWVKEHFVLGHADYHWRHESILYGWKPAGGGDRGAKGRHHFYPPGGRRTEDTVWHVARERVNASERPHPTMKPVALALRALMNSSRLGDVVFDGFGGAGATLLASEEAKRRCRLMELDPRHCDTVIGRWEARVGIAARLTLRTTTVVAPV
jgi:DNA modification methylase